jgi:hypothetical protein
LIVVLITSFEDSRSLNGLVINTVDRIATGSPAQLPTTWDERQLGFRNWHAAKKTAALKMDPRSMIAALVTRILERQPLVFLSTVSTGK